MPADLSPLNLRAWLQTAFGLCGCTDTEDVLGALVPFLEWQSGVMNASATPVDRPSFETLFGGNAGVFYVFAGALDRLDLSTHGTSVRGAWLTTASVQASFASFVFPR